MEEYQTESLMLKEGLHEVKEINGRRKEKKSGKRHVLKDKRVASTKEVEKALRKIETGTKGKKKAKKDKGKRTKKQIVSCEDDMDSSIDDSSDIQGPLAPQKLSCIEIAKQKS